MVQVCHPNDLRSILREVIEGDPQLDPARCHAYFYSAFERISFWVEGLGTGHLNLDSGSLFMNSLLPSYKPGGFPEKTALVPFGSQSRLYDVPDTHGKPLFAAARKKLGALQPGECYGFVPMISMGGEATLDGLRRYDARVHFALLAQAAPIFLCDAVSPSQIVKVRKVGR